jgi:hypothetical protein
VEHPLWREDGSVITCTIVSGPFHSSHFWVDVPQNSRPYFAVSFETPPTWRARSTYLYPPGTGWPSYTPGHWVSICRLLRLAGLRWRYSNTHPHDRWGTKWIYICYVEESRPPLWSSGQSSWLHIQRSGFDSRRCPLSLVSTIEELFGRQSSGSGVERREYGRRDPLSWPRDTLYPQKLALTSPTSVGRSVGRYSSGREGFYNNNRLAL